MDSIFTSPEFQMSLLLFVALGGYLIASRINQSAVVGLILVGIIVGPSVLGWITYTDFVRGSCSSRCGHPALCHRPGIQLKGYPVSQERDNCRDRGNHSVDRRDTGFRCFSGMIRQLRSLSGLH